MSRRRLAIFAAVEGVRSSLDSQESPRKIIDALVKDHDATCRWSKARWVFRLLSVSVEGEACNRALLQRWCDAALRAASSPRLYDVAPIERPAMLSAKVGRMLSKLAPTSLLVSATSALSERIEQSLEQLPDSQSLRPAARLWSSVALWLTQEPASGRAAREAAYRLRQSGPNGLFASRVSLRIAPLHRHSSPETWGNSSVPPVSECAEQPFVRPVPEAPAVRPQSNAPALHSDQGSPIILSVESMDVSSEVSPNGGAA